MRRLFVLTATLALSPLSAPAQQMDMAAMQKWAAADVVRYHIVGVHQGESFVAGDAAGLGDIADRVVIDLTWKLSEQELIGPVAIQNTKSTVSKLRDREPACLPPVLKGDFEFYDLLAVKAGLGSVLELTVRTTHPIVEVAQACTASRRAVPAKVRERPEEFVLPSPILFAMPLPKSGDLSVTADKKSFVMKKSGWTWTVTPSIAGR